MKREQTVVLGAGLTGLSLAYHLDPATPVFEREHAVGGMARTLSVGPYKFDLAPHLLHLRSDYVKELVFGTLGLRTDQYARSARIFFDGRIIPYPFEYSLYHVGESVRRDCLDGLSRIDRTLRGDDQSLRRGSYRDYALNAFGTGIAEHYLLPYNRKIWDTDPAEMTCEWMRLLPTADIQKILDHATTPNAESFGYNTRFHYPPDGIQALPEVFAAKLTNVSLGKQAVRIDSAARVVTFDDGDAVAYERLVSTIPLRTLIEITDLPDLKPYASRLVNTRVYTVNVVVKGTVPEGVHWMYFPDPALPFYRISFPKHYFEGSAPDAQHIIAVEVGSRDRRAVEELETEVVRALRGMPIFHIEDIVDVHTIEIPIAYCIYEADRTTVVQHVAAELRAHDIHTTGRYGFWEYSAMEDAILYGRTLASELAGSEACRQ